MIFQLTPDTEAPAEMHMFYPGLKALNLAENATHNLHNIYPIRGAQVRDANAWAKYLNEARDQFAPKADVVFAQHHWPVWGNARLLDYLAKQRDTYKYLHDQTLRLMNHGSRRPRSPSGWRCRRAWSASGTCAATTAPSATTPRPSTSAISAGTTPTRPTSIRCRRWSGRRRPWPTWAAPRPPSRRAREDFAKGEYRWVADAMSQVVFAEPDNQARARAGRRRDGAAGLSGRIRHLAQRLPARRAGAAPRQSVPAVPARAGRDIVRGLSLDLFFDFLGVRLNGEKAEGKTIVVNWAFPDIGERYALTLQNCALTYLAGRHAAAVPTATVTLDRTTLNRIILREIGAAGGDRRRVSSRSRATAMKVAELFGLLDDFTMAFEVIEPLRSSTLSPSSGEGGVRGGTCAARTALTLALSSRKSGERETRREHGLRLRHRRRRIGGLRAGRRGSAGTRPRACA